MGSIAFKPEYLEPTPTHYRAALEIVSNGGEVARIEVLVARSEAVERVAARVRQIIGNAPIGADLETWYTPGRPGYVKLVEHEGREMVLERAAEIMKARRLPAMVAEFCGEWTTETADKAHAFMSAARQGDVLNLGVLKALEVWAKAGDARADRAMNRLNLIDAGVQKGLPRPSAVSVLPAHVDTEENELDAVAAGAAAYFVAKTGRKPTRVELVARALAASRSKAVEAATKSKDAQVAALKRVQALTNQLADEKRRESARALDARSQANVRMNQRRAEQAAAKEQIDQLQAQLDQRDVAEDKRRSLEAQRAMFEREIATLQQEMQAPATAPAAAPAAPAAAPAPEEAEAQTAEAEADQAEADAAAVDEVPGDLFPNTVEFGSIEFGMSPAQLKAKAQAAARAKANAARAKANAARAKANAARARVQRPGMVAPLPGNVPQLQPPPGYPQQPMYQPGYPQQPSYSPGYAYPPQGVPTYAQPGYPGYDTSLDAPGGEGDGGIPAEEYFQDQPGYPSPDGPDGQ